MPRIALSLIAAVLVSCLAQRGSVGGDESLGTVRSQQRHALPSNRRVEDPLLAVRDGVTSDSELARERLPLWLVKRTELAPRLAVGGAIPIPPARRTAERDKGQPLDRVATARGNITSVVLSSLAIVLGLFFFVVWLARRAFPKTSTTLPSEVLEVLGRSPIASRHNLQLIRLGQRLLLVSVSSDGAETLAEITDTDEVNQLVGLCRENQPGSIAGTFRQVLHQLGTPPAARGRPARAASPDQAFAASGEPRHR